tara:strand:+ start:1643 stop:2080 length:438 start_codon:yes stop_codon:yes gene_type:complete
MSESSQTQEFNEADFMNAGITEGGAEGKTPLLPEADYDNCLVEDVKMHQPNEMNKEKGVQCRAQVTWSCESFNGPITTWINIKDPENPHKKSNLFKLISALWPDAETRIGKTPNDWRGERANLKCVHDVAPNGSDYADVRYRAVS